MADDGSSKKSVDVQGSSTFSDLDRGWSWVVMLVSFGSFLIIGGSVYADGIIHIALLNRYQQDISTTAWVGAVHSAMMNIGGIICVYQNGLVIL